VIGNLLYIIGGCNFGGANGQGQSLSNIEMATLQY
jgi:hypothetical protein